MILRKMTDADYDAAIELFTELGELHVQARPDCFKSRTKNEVFPPDHFSAWVKDEECLLLGAFDGLGSLMGLVRASLYSDSMMIKDLKNVSLDDIYVCPAFRRRGIATALYHAAEDWARSLGAERIDLHVWAFNEAALALYDSWGMQPQRYVLEKHL